MLKIIHVNYSEDRLKIHQFLDGKEKKISMYCNLFAAEKQHFHFIKCPDCDKKNICYFKGKIG